MTLGARTSSMVEGVGGFYYSLRPTDQSHLRRTVRYRKLLFISPKNRVELYPHPYPRGDIRFNTALSHHRMKCSNKLLGAWRSEARVVFGEAPKFIVCVSYRISSISHQSNSWRRCSWRSRGISIDISSVNNQLAADPARGELWFGLKAQRPWRHQIAIHSDSVP